MLEIDSRPDIRREPVAIAPTALDGRRRDSAPALSQNLPKIQPLPRWARVDATARDARDDAQAAAFFAGASLLALDQILRAGAGGADVSSAAKDSVEPCFSGVLRQRLALKAAATCARIARLREDEAGLRDAAHLAGFEAAPTPGARLNRLWRLFAKHPTRLNARVIKIAVDHLDLSPDIDGESLITVTHETMGENPLATVARVSAETMRILGDAPQIDAEIFALWFADLVLAQRLRWDAPLPLLATTIAHPSLRTAAGRRPKPSDGDWLLSVTRAYARAAQETYALAGELSRRSETLLRAAPKLRAKKAARVIDLLLADDCVSAARASRAAGLSDRSSRRLFDRLIALGAVRELSGRPNFRLYGL